MSQPSTSAALVRYVTFFSHAGTGQTRKATDLASGGPGSGSSTVNSVGGSVTIWRSSTAPPPASPALASPAPASSVSSSPQPAASSAHTATTAPIARPLLDLISAPHLPWPPGHR